MGRIEAPNVKNPHAVAVRLNVDRYFGTADAKIRLIWTAAARCYKVSAAGDHPNAAVRCCKGVAVDDHPNAGVRYCKVSAAGYHPNAGVRRCKGVAVGDPRKAAAVRY